MDCKCRQTGTAPRNSSTSRKRAFVSVELHSANKRAFTLIELLIVIAVIAVLISMLLPTLNKASYIAKRAGCLSNINQQHVAQMSYAANNKGKFPPRYDCGADYVRVFGDNDGPWYGMRKAGNYLPNLQIFICPLMAHFKDTGWTGGLYTDPYFYYQQWPGYGGWGADRDCVISAYAWFANYRPDLYTFAPDEPKWPKNLGECDKNQGFISHRITYSTASCGGQFDDWGHLGSDRHNAPNSCDFDELATAPDQPVGHADGHVEIHSRSQIHARTLGGGWYGAEWYY